MKKDEGPTYREYPDFQRRLRELHAAKQAELDAVRAAMRSAIQAGADEPLDEAATRQHIEHKYALLMAQAHLEEEVPVLHHWHQALALGAQASYHDEWANTPMQPHTKHAAQLHRHAGNQVVLEVLTTLTLPFDQAAIEAALAQYGLHEHTWKALTVKGAPIAPDVSPEQVQAAVKELLTLGYRDITEQVRHSYRMSDFCCVLLRPSGESLFCQHVASLFSELHAARKQQHNQQES